MEKLPKEKKTKAARKPALTLEFPKDVRDSLQTASDDLGMTKVELLTRVWRFYLHQSPKVQPAILGHVKGEAKEALLQSALEDMVKASRVG